MGGSKHSSNLLELQLRQLKRRRSCLARSRWTWWCRQCWPATALQPWQRAVSHRVRRAVSQPLASISRTGKGSAKALSTDPGAVERLERLLAAAAEEESVGLEDSASLEETDAWVAGERDRVLRMRAAATAALLLLEEGRFPAGRGPLKDQVLVLASQLDGRLASLAVLLAAYR